MTIAFLAALAVFVVGLVPLIWMLRQQPEPSIAATPELNGLIVAATRNCDYCTTEIPAQATRCPSCAGEFRYCPNDKRLVGTTSRQKFVGLLRGGMKTQFRCTHCDRVLDGPTF